MVSFGLRLVGNKSSKDISALTMPSAIAFGPYFGGLADRWGRRPVYSTALTGILLELVALYVVCKC